MSLFCAYEEAPACYDETYLNGLVETLCSYESVNASSRVVLSLGPLVTGNQSVGTTFTDVTGGVAQPFTVPALGPANWDILISMGVSHVSNTCGLEVQFLIDGVVIGHAHFFPVSTSSVRVQNIMARATATQGNHTFTVQARRTDVFGGCASGTVATFGTMRVILQAIPQ